MPYAWNPMELRPMGEVRHFRDSQRTIPEVTGLEKEILVPPKGVTLSDEQRLRLLKVYFNELFLEQETGTPWYIRAFVLGSGRRLKDREK